MNCMFIDSICAFEAGICLPICIESCRAIFKTMLEDLDFYK